MAQGLDLKAGELPDLFPHTYAGGGKFLQPGATLVTEIQGLGRLTNPIVVGCRPPSHAFVGRPGASRSRKRRVRPLISLRTMCSIRGYRRIVNG